MTIVKLVEDWRDFWKWYSTWALTTIGGIQTYVLTYATPEQLAAPILFYPSMTWGQGVASLTTFLAVTGFIGRLISQKKKTTPDPQPQEV